MKVNSSTVLVCKQDVWYRLWVCSIFCGKSSVRHQAYGRSARLRPAAVDEVMVCGELHRQAELLHSAAAIRSVWVADRQMTLNCQCIGTVTGGKCQTVQGRYGSAVT